MSVLYEERFLILVFQTREDLLFVQIVSVSVRFYFLPSTRISIFFFVLSILYVKQFECLTRTQKDDII